MVMKKEKKPTKTHENYVVKSNSLVEARYRLSLQEMQVILWLLTQIKPEDEDFKPHRMEITEFAKMIGVTVDSRYGELRKVTKRLMQRVMEIHHEENHEILQIAWLSSATYQSRKGYVTLKFSPELQPYLLQLKSHFTKIDVVDTLKLKSIYAIRVFELLLQYVSIGSRKTNIDELRKYCGINPEEYSDYFDLKRNVIQKAKTEINEKTEYEIDYREIKESRKIVSIEWTIKKKTHFEKSQKEKTLIIQKEMRSANALVEEITEYGFSRVTAKKFLQKYSEDVIKDALKSVNLQIERNNVKNPKAMLRVAMQEVWKPDIYVPKKQKNLKQRVKP